MRIKPEIRILGVDDSPFVKGQKMGVLVVGTIYRGGSFMDGLISCHVHPDGTDATDSFVTMINKSKHKSQLRAIFLNGIAVAGFNVIDIQKLNKKTGLPVIVIMRNHPNMKKIVKALENLPDGAEKYKTIQKAGAIEMIVSRRGQLHIQRKGISMSDAVKLIDMSSTHSRVPEPLRMAHLIAGGIVDGESRGRA